MTLTANIRRATVMSRVQATLSSPKASRFKSYSGKKRTDGHDPSQYAFPVDAVGNISAMADNLTGNLLPARLLAELHVLGLHLL